MSKFFVQLLLSVIVGVSAAFGFSPSVKGKLYEALQQADTSVHEMVNAVAQNVSDVAASISSDSSIKTSVEVSAESDEKAEFNGSSTNESATHVETHERSLNVELKDKSKSALNLDLDSGE